MTKVIKIIENNSITGVQYGLVEIPDIVETTSIHTPIKKTSIAAAPQPAPQQAPVIKQPGRSWQTKMSAAKKRIQDATKTKHR